MISNELLEEIIFLSKQDKLIGRRLIRKIVLQVISSLDQRIKDNFTGISCKKRIESFAETNIDDGFITINLNLCYSDLNNKNTTTLNKNLWLATTLLHEIEHLKEPYKIEQDNLEGKLINISNYVCNTNLRNELYYKDPSEKIAYALSVKYLLESLKKYPNFKKEHFKEFKSINDEYITKLQFGYKKHGNTKYNSSLIDFMSILKILNHLDQIGFKLVKSNEQKNIDRLNLEQKFMYGLPVTDEEVKKLNKGKKLIIR